MREQGRSMECENIVGWTEECENKEDQWNVLMASSAGVQQ